MSQRYEFLVNKFRKKLETSCLKGRLFAEDSKDQYKESILQTLSKKLWDLDPTPKKIRAEAIFKWYSEDPFKEEDFYKVTENLNLFENHKNLASEKDLSKFKTYHDFFTMMIPVLEKISNQEENKSNNAKERDLKKEVYEDTDIIATTDDYILLVPKTKKAAQYHGRGTQWCTSAEKNNQFSNYTKSGKLFILIEKKTPENQNPTKYQFHFQSKQFMDCHDRYVYFMDLPYFKKYLDNTKKDHQLLKSFIAFFVELQKKSNNPKYAMKALSQQEIHDIVSYNPKLYKIAPVSSFTEALLLKILKTEKISSTFNKNPLPDHLHTEDVMKALEVNNKDYIVRHLYNHPLYGETAKTLLKNNPNLFDSVQEENLTKDLILEHVHQDFTKSLPKSLLTDDVIQDLIEHRPDYFIKKYPEIYGKDSFLKNQILDKIQENPELKLPLIQILESMFPENPPLFPRDVLEAHIDFISQFDEKYLKTLQKKEKSIDVNSSSFLFSWENQSLKDSDITKTYIALIQKNFPINYIQRPLFEEKNISRNPKHYSSTFMNFLKENPSLFQHISQKKKKLDHLAIFCEFIPISQNDLDNAFKEHFSYHSVENTLYELYKKKIQEHQKNLDFYDTPESLKKLAHRFYQEIKKIQRKDISDVLEGQKILIDYRKLPKIYNHFLEIIQTDISLKNKEILEFLKTYVELENRNISCYDRKDRFDLNVNFIKAILLYTKTGHFSNANKPLENITLLKENHIFKNNQKFFQEKEIFDLQEKIHTLEKSGILCFPENIEYDSTTKKFHINLCQKTLIEEKKNKILKYFEILQMCIEKKISLSIENKALFLANSLCETANSEKLFTKEEQTALKQNINDLKKLCLKRNKKTLSYAEKLSLANSVAELYENHSVAIFPENLDFLTKKDFEKFEKSTTEEKIALWKEQNPNDISKSIHHPYLGIIRYSLEKVKGKALLPVLETLLPTSDWVRAYHLKFDRRLHKTIFKDYSLKILNPNDKKEILINSRFDSPLVTEILKTLSLSQEECKDILSKTKNNAVAEYYLKKLNLSPDLARILNWESLAKNFEKSFDQTKEKSLKLFLEIHSKNPTPEGHKALNKILEIYPYQKYKSILKNIDLKEEEENTKSVYDFFENKTKTVYNFFENRNIREEEKLLSDPTATISHETYLALYLNNLFKDIENVFFRTQKTLWTSINSEPLENHPDLKNITNDLLDCIKNQNIEKTEHFIKKYPLTLHQKQITLSKNNSRKIPIMIFNHDINNITYFGQTPNGDTLEEFVDFLEKHPDIFPETLNLSERLQNTP